jgi:hypothetical protein
MPTIHLKLSVGLADTVDSSGLDERGVLFHRWLPNGSADAISFSGDRWSLGMWFDRRGFVQNGLIRHDMRRFEVDDSVMSRQGWLEAGPLMGEATFGLATSAELAALREDRKGSAEYVALGKRVLEVLVPRVQQLIETLRIQYGQYWLRRLHVWDSRTLSLGAYCRSILSLEWRELVDEEWRRFAPTDLMQMSSPRRLPGRGFGEYLTEADWRTIQAEVPAETSMSLALQIAARAHALADSGYLPEAFIQASTALEVALDHLMDDRSATHDAVVRDLLAPLGNLPLKQRLATIAVATDRVPPDLLVPTVNGIDTRNAIVHEGLEPTDASLPLLQAMIKSTRDLLGLSELKTPCLTDSNELAASSPNSAR